VVTKYWYSVRSNAQVLTLIRGPVPIVLRVRLCYRSRKEQPDLSITSGVIPDAPSVYIPTAKFNFLGFLKDDGYVGGPGGGGRGLLFLFSPNKEH
jgi:hypothetical protein